MAKKSLAPLFIKGLGWLLGLATATAGDYFLIPLLAKKDGGLPVAIAIGLPWGILVMVVFAFVSRYLATRLAARLDAASKNRKRVKGDVPPLPLPTRILVVILFVVTTVSLIYTGVPTGGLLNGK